MIYIAHQFLKGPRSTLALLSSIIKRTMPL